MFPWHFCDIPLYGYIWKPPHESFKTFWPYLKTFPSLAVSITSFFYCHYQVLHNSRKIHGNTATESLSLHILPARLLTAAEWVSLKGERVTRRNDVALGPEVEASEPPPGPPVGPSFLCSVRTASSAFHLLFASQWPRADSWRAHMTSFGAAAHCGSSWWMPYWGGDGADSLSKLTLQARLCVPKLSDRFREICCEIAARRRHHPLLFAAPCAGHKGFFSASASEQRLSVPRWDYNACSARLHPDGNNDLSGRLLS